MRLLDPYAPSSVYKKIIAQYGGEYSFFERLKMGGVGSPKLSYVSGIPAFDAIHYTDDLEHSTANIELLKDGLILRINKRQKLAVAIERMEVLASIQLEPAPTSPDTASGKAGTLTLLFREQSPVVFHIGAAEYVGVERFFQKKVLLAFR